MKDSDVRSFISSSNEPDRSRRLVGSKEPMWLWDEKPTEVPEGMRVDYFDENKGVDKNKGYILVYEDTNIIFNLVPVE